MRENMKIILIAVICAIVLIIAPIFYTYFIDYRAIKSFETSAKNPTITGKEASSIIAKVGTAEKIPKDEIPTVVRITDVSLLSAFGQIRKGDYILLYHQSGLAVVFDEITNRIISAVPVNIKNQNVK